MRAVGIDVGQASLDLAVGGHLGVARFTSNRSGIAEIVKRLLAIEAPYPGRGYEWL